MLFVAIWSGALHGFGDRLPLLVESGWLAKNNELAALHIVEVGRSRGDYNAGHIPGAAFLDRRAIWAEVDGVAGMLPPQQTVLAELEKIGISSDSTIVVYDGSSGLWAARLFWALEYIGHTDAHILNGGWQKWIADDQPAQTGAPTVVHGHITTQMRSDLLATRQWLLDNLSSPGLQIVDTRTPNEFSGGDARSARGGHIPGAVNVNWVSNITRNEPRTFLPQEDLAEIYDPQKVPKGKVVVTLCQTGVRGAHTYFVLRLLGYPKVRLYDGSWAEWGNTDSTPITKGEQSVD